MAYIWKQSYRKLSEISAYNLDYGFRNFENYRMKVLVHHGWNGMINKIEQVPSPVNRVEPRRQFK
jgi:hypothetical protein